MISTTALVNLVLSLLAAFICSWGLLLPFFSSGQSVDEVNEGQAELSLKRDNALNSLLELDQELASGKIAEQDYEHLRAELLAEAAVAIKALDEHTQARSYKHQTVSKS